MPRSANEIPDPTTRSVTVRETRISPGAVPAPRWPWRYPVTLHRRCRRTAPPRPRARPRAARYRCRGGVRMASGTDGLTWGIEGGHEAIVSGGSSPSRCARRWASAPAEESMLRSGRARDRPVSGATPRIGNHRSRSAGHRRRHWRRNGASGRRAARSSVRRGCGTPGSGRGRAASCCRRAARSRAWARGSRRAATTSGRAGPRHSPTGSASGPPPGECAWAHPPIIARQTAPLSYTIPTQLFRSSDGASGCCPGD